MDIPKCLYRGIGDSHEVIYNHLLGRLWFRSPAFFRMIEGPASDCKEGIGTYEVGNIRNVDVADSRPIQPAYFMSFSEDVEATRRFGGKHYLVLNDPVELMERVKAALPPKITSVTWQRIRYDKSMNLDRDPTPSESKKRKYFSKPESFSHEKEWRLFVLFRHRLRLMNETMKLDVGNLQGVFKLIRR